jgi:HEXXH motif-containing protein
MSCRRAEGLFVSALMADRMPDSFRVQNKGTSEGLWSLQELRFLAAALRGVGNEPLAAVRKEALAWDVLSEGEVELRSFARQVSESIGLLRSLGADYEMRIESLVLEIVPVVGLPDCTTWRPEGVGMSSHSYFGGVFIGLPKVTEHARLHLAMNVAHEMGHQALMAYQLADDILESPHELPVYSAVRQTLRPAILSFHALVAIMSMLEFAQRSAQSALLNPAEQASMADWEEKLRGDLRQGLNALKVVKPTELGQAILSEAEAALT